MDFNSNSMSLVNYLTHRDRLFVPSPSNRGCACKRHYDASVMSTRKRLSSSGSALVETSCVATYLDSLSTSSYVPIMKDTSKKTIKPRAR